MVPRHPARERRGQEQYGIDNLLGTAEPPKRNAFEGTVISFGSLAAVRTQLGRMLADVATTNAEVDRRDLAATSSS
jgi:hypothetical protein